MVRPLTFTDRIRPDDYRVLPNFIEHALRKQPLPIHGDGRNTVFCYINDGLRRFRVLFSRPTVKLSTWKPWAEISTSERDCQNMPYQVEILNIDHPGLPRVTRNAVAYITKLSGDRYKPRTALGG